MVTIRSYQSDDLDALYAISLGTGNAGTDASALYRNGRLIGDIYSAPYAILAPELVLVAEDADGVAGFVLGALDTKVWLELLERHWWPKVRQEYPAPTPAEKERWPSDARRVEMIHFPDSPPASVQMVYPGHVHLNILPRLQGLGVGKELFEAWLDLTKHHGAISIHAGVNHANTRAIRFWRGMGFQDVTPEELRSGRTIWMGCG